MSSIVHYKKGSGPYPDSTGGKAAYYAKYKQIALELIAKANNGDTEAKKKLQPSRDGLANLMQRSASDVPNMRMRSAYSDVQGVPILASLSVAYAAPSLVGLEVFPVVPSPYVQGDFWVYDRGERMKEKRTQGRGVYGASNEVRTKKSRESFEAKPHSLAGKQSIAVALNADPALNEMVDLVEAVNYDLEFKREVMIAQTVTDDTLYPAGNKVALTAGVRWDDANGTPATDIMTGRDALWAGQGDTRVVAVMSSPVWTALRTHPDILSLLSINDRGFIRPDQFLEVFEIDGLLVSDARINIAEYGKAPDDTYLWGNNFVLARVSTTPQVKNATLGYTFRWVPGRDMPAGGTGPIMVPGLNAGQGVWTMQWVDPTQGAFGTVWYKRSHFETYEVVSADTGYLIQTPIDPAKF